MGIYAEQVLPRIVNVVCGMKASEPIRGGCARGSTDRSSRSASDRG